MVESNSKTSRSEEKSYDDVLYKSNGFPHTHARNLYTIAKLFNLDPPGFKNCRVLELGCACGGNLFSQAQQYPDSEFVGIDISGKQISEANKILDVLQFKNIKFVQEDMTNIGAELGSFDYIISNGILSWVPADVQQALFDIYQNHLSKNGIGFISYNTLPGWNMVKSMREAMKYHAKRFDEPQDQINQSKAFLKFLSENVNQNDPYKQTIDKEIENLKKADDYYIFHEYLETENHQFYFHEFIKNISDHDLQYVGDIIVSSMYAGNLPEPAAKGVHNLGGNIVMQEQYMDFLKNRRFRDSIVTHSHAKIDRNIKTEAIFHFLVTANMKVNQEQSTKDKIVFQQVKHGTNLISFDDPKVTEVFLKLIQNGLNAFYFTDIIKEVCTDEEAAKRIYATILKVGTELVFKGFLFIHSDRGNFTSTISEKPIANPVSRHQASQLNCNIITNSLGENVKVNHFICLILSYLDGTNDVKEITDEVLEKLKSGELKHNKNSPNFEDIDELQGKIKDILSYFAKNAILIG